MRAGAVRTFLGLGSNLGDRLANLQEAIDRLGSVDGIHLVRASRVYETAPVGPPQPDYLNGVVEAETTMGPGELLEACLGVEAAMGRVRGARWGPRAIDIDVLTYGREEIDQPGLTVPHPRMHERAFVLAPLLELEPNPVLPGGRRLATLRLGPEALAGVTPFAPPLSISAPGVPRAADSVSPRTRPEAPKV